MTDDKTKDNKTEEKVISVIEQYEKIGNRAYLLDRISGYLFTGAILLLLTLGLYLFFIIAGKQNAPENDEFYRNILPILIQFLLYSSTALLLGSLIFQWSALGYKKLKNKQYEKTEVIRLYLIELSNNPESSRKGEIIKHLIYNLIRLKETEGKKDFVLLNHYHWKTYHKIGHKAFKFQTNIILKTISFIEEAVIFLNLDDYKLQLLEIGELIKKKDYRGIANLFMKNQELFNKIEEMKRESKLIGMKGNLKKVKNLFEWISIHGRNWIAIIILIILFILFILGRIQIPPIP